MDCSALVLVSALVRLALPALAQLTELAYRFRRIWAAQEFVNALDPIIHCGDLQIDWRNLWLAARALRSNNALLAMNLTAFTYRDSIGAHEGVISFYTIASMRLRTWGYMGPSYMAISWALGGDGHDQAPARLLSLRGLRPHEKLPIRRDLWAILEYERISRPNALQARAAGNIMFNAEDPEILIVLNSTRSFLATNPVDRIYALLGLVRDLDLDDPDFRIEYSAAQSPAIVCKRFAAGMMKQGRGAAVLGLAAATKQACQTGSYGPSWVPDWTSPIPPSDYVESLNLLMHGQDYAEKSEHAMVSYFTAGPSTMEVRFEDADNTLLVRGTLFDPLILITKGGLFAPPSWYLSILQNYAKTAQPGMDPDRIDVALCRTLIADQNSKGEKAPPGLAKQYHAYKARLATGLGQAVILAGASSIFCLAGAILCLRRIGWIYPILAYAPIWLMGWDNQPLHTIAAIIQLCNDSIPVILIGCSIVAWRAKELFYASLMELDIGWQYLAGWSMRYNPADRQPVCADFMEAFLPFAGRHNLGITVAGYVGRFPLAAQAGDKVMILEGGFTPFLLRPVEGDRTFKLVGECYVHGIMNGEAWEEASKQLEEIRIV